MLEQIRQDLVSTVSHELRTPLAAIYGSALTLARPDLDLEPAMHKRLLEVIVEESTRLADIVNELLLASQLDADRLDGAHRALRRAHARGRASSTQRALISPKGCG